MTLDTWLSTMGRQLGAERASCLAVRVLLVLGGASAIVVMSAALAGVGGDLRWLLLLAPAAAVLTYVLRRWFLRTPRDVAARALDARLGLRERVATSLWLDAGSAQAGFVQQDALRSLATLDPGALKRSRRPGIRIALATVVGLGVVALVVPFVPSLRGGYDDDPIDVAARAAETKRVQEAARRLARDAGDLEQALARRGLEHARMLAKRTADESRRLGLKPPGAAEALARVTALRDDVERASRLRTARPEETSSGAADPRAFGRADEAAEAVARLAARLGMTLNSRLQGDLAATQQALESAGASGAPAALDTDALKDLLQQLEALEKLLAEVAKALPEGSSLQRDLASLTDEQRALLSRIQDELQRLAKRCEGGGQCSSSEMAQAAAAMRALDSEALDNLLQQLQALQALEALEDLLASASESMGECEGSENAARKAALARLLAACQGQSQALGPKVGRGPGRANGGQEARGQDDGRGETASQIPGRLDPRGRMDHPIPFRGLPGPGEAKLEFDRAIGRAAEAAEEALGRDLLPPGARPFVRRYFEALKERK